MTAYEIRLDTPCTQAGEEMNERMVEITDRDVEFVRSALQHYEVFAKAAASQGQNRTEGVMRAQAFYAERFLSRIAPKPTTIKEGK